MLNPISNISTNFNDNSTIFFEDHQPAHKKVRFNPEDCPVQKYEANSGKKLSITIPASSAQRLFVEIPLSQRDITQLNTKNSPDGESCESECFWQDALDHARITGNANALFKLIKEDALLDDLDEDEREEIVDFGLVFDKREILIECAKNKLLANTRLDILIFAINSNDFELTQAVCNGKKDVLSKWKWCAQPFVVLDNYKATGIDSRIFDFLLSQFSLNANNIEEHGWRKYLAGLWDINGYFTLCNHKLDYQGSQIHQFTDRILSTLYAFKNQKTDAMDNELAETLIKLVNESRTDISDEERLKSFCAGKPIMIHAGFPEHHMEVVLREKYLLICNKGSLSEMPVKVFSIDPKLLTMELFKKIRNCADNFSEEDAEEFYTDTLPNMLNGISHITLSNLFTQNWIDESLDQAGDNCVWESLRTALFGVTGLDAWIKNGCENGTNSDFQQQTISEGLEQLLPWDKYVGLFSLGQYIDYSASDPTAMDRNLVLAILNQAKELMYAQNVDNFHYEEVLSKFIHTRAKAIKIENANLVMDVEGF